MNTPDEPSSLVSGIWEEIDPELVVEATRTLVEATPPDRPHDTDTSADRLGEYLRDAGCASVRKLSDEPNKSNLLARFGSGEEPRLVWNGHLDVVPASNPGDWSHDPFRGVREDGKLFGRGVSDMKGSFGALIGALEALSQCGVELSGQLVVQAAADEETLGPAGTRFLLEEEPLGADAGICGEPTSLTPLIAARGLHWWRVTTRGKSCHASVPEQGVNALVKMAKVIESLNEMPLSAEHPVIGGATLSMDTIQGGSATNIVPDRVEMTMDRRLVPGEDSDGAKTRIRERIRELERADPELRVDAELFTEAEPSEIDPDEPIVKLCGRVAQQVTGEEVSPGGMSGATDARLLINRADIPTVIYGPGSLKQAHVVDEHVEVDQLVRGAKCYAAVIAEFLG